MTIPDYERIQNMHTPKQPSREEGQANRNWQSARTLLDALILAGIIWIVSSQLDSRDQQAKDRQESRVQAAMIMGQIATIQYGIADVPRLRDEVAHIGTLQQELMRRQSVDESLRDEKWKHL